MEGGTHDVKEFNSDIGSRSGISHIGETDDFYDANKSVPENDENTILESDDASSNVSSCPSEGVHIATVIDYTYGLQSFGSVMPKVLPSMVQDLIYENGTGSGTQPKNITDVTMLPPLDVPTPHTTNTANAQEVLYSDAEMPHVANKQPISDITRAVRDVIGDTEEISMSHISDSGHEESLIGCLVSITGSVDGDSANGDNLNLFPTHQPIINQFLNHNKSSYDQGYDSDGKLPFWDPIAAAEDPDTYGRGSKRDFPSLP
eukprot:15349602-Ditylum_brightwellii.AAC.1